VRGALEFPLQIRAASLKKWLFLGGESYGGGVVFIVVVVVVMVMLVIIS